MEEMISIEILKSFYEASNLNAKKRNSENRFLKLKRAY
jgi:hypothetical protein